MNIEECRQYLVGIDLTDEEVEQVRDALGLVAACPVEWTAVERAAQWSGCWLPLHYDVWQ